MSIELIQAQKTDHDILQRLLELYCYDFSEILQTDVDAHGLFHYPYLDLYFEEENRHPYLVKVKGKYAGFVLINSVLQYLDDPKARAIAEFFILRKYRRKGVGKEVAFRAFARFPGKWEVSVLASHTSALTFWKQTIGAYTGDTFEVVDKVYRGREKQIILFEQ
ncbi:MAG: GNAT family N-acetyltransferase [Bacteroidota bacterium]